MRQKSHIIAIFLFSVLAGIFFIATGALAAFSLTAAPANGTVNQGGTIHFIATATYASLPAENIGFNVVGLPADATATFSTGSCTPTCSTIVSINPGSATPGVYLLTVQGLGSISDASASYTLTVVDPAIPALVPKTLTQTDDGSTTTGFNLSGRSFSGTAVSGTGNSASVVYSSTTATPVVRGAPAYAPLYQGGGQYTSVDAVSASTIFVSSVRRDDNFNYSVVVHKTTDGGASWTSVTASTGGGAKRATAIKALDANTVFVSYGDSDTTLKLLKSTDGGATWTASTADAASGSVNETSLAATDANTLFISYYDGGNLDLKFAKSTNGGTSWTTSTVDSTGNVGRYSSIEATDASTLFISYYDVTNLKPKFAKSTDGGTSWTTSTLSDTTGSGSYTSLEAIDASTLIMAYRFAYTVDEDYYQGVRLATSTNGGTSWTLSTAAGGLNQSNYYGSYLSLKAINASTLFLSYQNESSADLVFSSSANGGTTWTASTIESTGSTGGYTSIDAIDANTVFITFQGQTTNGLKFASSGYTTADGTYTSGSIDLAGAADITTLGLSQASMGNQVKGVGANFYGQLGNGTTDTATTAAATAQGLSNVVAVAASGEDTYPYSLALLADGTVKAWGYNGYGQLGDGSTTQRTSPVYVCSTGTDCQTNAANRLSGVAAIAVGGQYSLALLADGTVKAWGYNGNGRLGDGTTTQRLNPVSVSGISTAVAIAAGGAHSLAVLADGTVKAWGYNGYGQLGDGSTTQRTTPVTVSGITDAVAVAASASTNLNPPSHSLALLADGTVKAWGYNGQGQLGDGTTTQRTTPVYVCSTGTDCQTNAANRLGSAVSIAAGGSAGYAGGGGHSLAIIADGTVKAWGHNNTGQLGDGTTTARVNPVSVSGLSNVVAIAAGGKYGSGGTSYVNSLALKADGTAWGWGANILGSLGDGTTTQRTTPVQATTVSGVTAIAAGAYHSLFASGGIRAEIAANTDNATWTYKGVPIQAGRASSTNLSLVLGTSNRYVKYRLTMSTYSGTVGGSVGEVAIYYPTTTNFNFTLGVSPGSTSLGLSALSANATVTATVEGAYDSLTPVAFSYAVSPSVANGPTVSFAPGSSCTPSGGTPACSTTMTVSRVVATPAGNYTVTIYGDNGTLMKQTAFAVTVLPPLDFSLSASLSSGEVIRGFESVSSVQTVLTVQYLGGENEIVGITSNAPVGVIFSPSPTACAPAPGSCSSTITMSAQSGAATGDFTITITGTSATSGVTHTTSFVLRVRDPIDYSLSLVPNAGAIFQGNSTTSSLTASYVNGVSEGISFTNFTSTSNPSAFSLLPSSGIISVSFSGIPCTLGPAQPACAKTVTFSTSSNITPGIYNITVSGVSATTGTIKNVTYALNVSGPFDFIMTYPTPPCASGTVCAGTAEQGTSMTISFDITSYSAAGENVIVSVGGLPANTTAGIIYTPNPCIPSTGNSCTVTIAISPATDAPIGTFGLNIEARSSQQMHALSYTLSIVQGFTFDVALSASSGFAMKGGAALSVLANVTLMTGVGKQVDLAVDIAPTGSGVVTSFPSGTSCTPNCQKQISFTAPISAITGAYTVTVRGSYGTQTKQATYVLTVADPFDFSLTLSSVQGSVLQGGTIQTGATITWLSGGTGADTVSLSASVVPVPTAGSLGVDFSPSVLTNVGQANSPQTSVVTMNPSADLTSDSYRVIVMAMSGTTIKTQMYNLTVGTTLDFTFAPAPDNERVLQGNQSSPIVFTATNTSPADQPGASTISFTVGDTSKYKLPKGVTIIPTPISSCSLGAVVGSTCTTSLVFAVDATAIDGTYNIPILGSSGFVKRLAYFTLKIGPLNLLTYTSPDFFTDPHQRPQVAFSWSPSVVFAGDTVQLSAASSTVYVTGQPGVLAQTPVSTVNAASVWSGIGPVPSLPDVSIIASRSGLLNATLEVADATGASCYTSDSSASEACACRVSSSAIGSGILDQVSAPRPFFREIKPQ